MYNQRTLSEVIEQYGLTEYGYRRAQAAFSQWGTAGLIGLGTKQLIEPLAVEAERRTLLDTCDQDGLDPEGLW